MKKIWQFIKRALKFILNVFTRRLWLKILSVVLALIVWSYIISTNTSLTRTKSFSGLTVETGSVSELTAKTLALATDIQSVYSGAIDVSVDVPQSQYSQLAAENITLTADFSAISSTGKYEVPISANSTYGTIERISPSTVQVTIEDLVSRNITAELEVINEDDENYWYNIQSATLNPAIITVSGPSSIMQSVYRAVVQVDVSGRSSTVRRGYTTVSLRDSNNNEISTRLLTLSTRASIVYLEIYPKKRLDLIVDTTQLKIPEGYELAGISLQPESIVVAGSSDLLDSLDSLPISVSELEDASGIHNCKVIIPSGIKYSSTEEVTLTVTVMQIQEEDAEGE